MIKFTSRLYNQSTTHMNDPTELYQQKKLKVSLQERNLLFLSLAWLTSYTNGSEQSNKIQPIHNGGFVYLDAGKNCIHQKVIWWIPLTFVL